MLLSKFTRINYPKKNVCKTLMPITKRTYCNLSTKTHNFVRFDGGIINTSMITLIEKKYDTYDVNDNDTHNLQTHTSYQATKRPDSDFHNYIDNLYKNTDENIDKSKDFVKVDRYAINLNKIERIYCDIDENNCGIVINFQNGYTFKNNDPNLYNAIKKLCQSVPKTDLVVKADMENNNGLKPFIIAFIILVIISLLFSLEVYDTFDG